MIKVQSKELDTSKRGDDAYYEREYEFDSFEEACEYAGSVTMDLKSPIVILSMYDPKTGEEEFF